MIIAHASDTHNRPSIVTAVGNVECDVIVISGDILANKGRIRAGGWEGPSGIVPFIERKYQDSWFRPHAKKWVVAFKGRPVVYVPGNHDYICIEKWLRHYGHTNIYTLSAEQPYVDVCGKRFAGFREINWIAGEWQGESFDLTPYVDRAMACDPDILVTHAPPAGILDGEDGYGVKALTSALFYREHKITHHLFGHEHSCGGRTMVEGGIYFANAAGHLMVHTI